MAVASLYPAIKPSLLLDFANTKKLDPRVTFTRSTTAAYYDGVTTAKAEENLLKYSQEFDDAAWSKNISGQVTISTDSTAAPDGTTTADTATPNALSGYHVVRQAGNTSAALHTFSLFVKPNGYTQVGLREDYASGQYSVFDLTSTGSIVDKTVSASASIVALNNGWYRVTLTPTATSTNQGVGIYILDGSYVSGDPSSYLYTGDGVSGIYLWGAQLEQRSSVTAYTPTTTQPITNYIPVLLTAPANVPRFDHNPTTGESLGLLIEEQRTNLFTYSDDFADASWTKSNATIDSNTVVAPDGTLTGDTVVETTATGGHSVRKSSSVTSGTFYTISAFVKAAGRNWVRIAFSTGFTSTNTWFDIANGVVGTVGATSASITDVGNGWYRISATQAATSTTTGLFFITMETSGSGVTYTGDGWSGIYIWGAQLEAGSFPTSYIPTTSATVTRNADLAVMAGSNFSSWYNAGEGTFYFESTWSKPTTSQVYVLSSGSSVRYIYDSSSSASSMSVSSFDGTNVLGGGSGLSGFLKIVSSYSNATGTKQIASNGGTVYSGAYNGNFATNTTILFGETAFCGNIKKIAYYPQRLTNANLQALTT